MDRDELLDALRHLLHWSECVGIDDGGDFVKEFAEAQERARQVIAKHVRTNSASGESPSGREP